MKKISKNPLLSVVIPCYNEEDDIAECLKSIGEQSHQKYEIIIIDDGCTDKTIEIVDSFPKTRVLKQDHKGYGAGCNLGAEKAKGEILILVDADMTFNKDYFKDMIEPIVAQGKIGTEEETQLATNLDKIWSRCWGKVITDPKNKERKVFRAIRRDKYLEMGGFDPKYGYADDQTFYFKYGLTSDIAKGAICYHKNPETLKKTYRQSRWIGSSTRAKWIEVPVINLIVVGLMYLLSPLAIPALAIKKAIRNKEFGILGYIMIYMVYRYLGNLEGYLRKIFLNKNVM